jgi:hypothetical protein
MWVAFAVIGGKAARAWRLPIIPSNDEAKNSRSYTSFHISLRGFHRDIFTFSSYNILNSVVSLLLERGCLRFIKLDLTKGLDLFCNQWWNVEIYDGVHCFHRNVGKHVHSCKMSHWKMENPANHIAEDISAADIVIQIWRSCDRASLTYSFKYNQQDATLYNILYCCQCSTCFRRFLRRSSGAQKLYTQHLVHVKLAVAASKPGMYQMLCVQFELLMIGGVTAWNM